MNIFHKSYRVKAEVVQIHGFSGHADQADLLRMLAPLKATAERVYLVHGESEQSETPLADSRGESPANSRRVGATST